ncbi:uncharacterized protein LOC130589518 [Beta vulgaris subsp. vulgaris]|uniref:uncharacterized protein LOC130589518 n=1 Tax=Beta vulgaris subsp. vulgaris TaxID=3555 RepID=UPI0025465A15|nr:uncharacterized protein LOC130589518 [Beta vulgaris subsp. vulgaris]
MDNIGFWNTRGLNSPQKYPDVRWFLEHHGVGLCGLLETRVRRHNFPKVFGRFGSKWSVVTNYNSHPGGRIWVIWLPSKFAVNVVECTEQVIHCSVEVLATGMKCWVTMVYGMNDAQERLLLWLDLQRISKGVTGAWLVGGDFNNVLHLNERIGSPVTLDEVMEFRQCLRNCELQEQVNVGPFFTWSNKQEGCDRVFSRIDRVVVNEKWMEQYPNAETLFLPENISDHCPCLIKLDKRVINKPKPFRFFNMWTEATSFMERVQAGWEERIQGTPMFIVVKKLKGLKRGLKELNKERFADVENAADEAYKKLIGIQQQIHQDPRNAQLHRIEGEAKDEYLALNKARLSFLQQKVKQQWVKNGDSNTAYFHSCLKQRRIQNKVSRIKNLAGSWQEK